MQNEDRDFRPIGNLVSGVSELGPPSSIPAPRSNGLPTHSGTTGPAPGKPRSIGTGHLTTISGQTLPIATLLKGGAEAHQVNQALRDLVARRRNGQPVNSGDVQQAMHPASPMTVVEELTKLRMLTKAKTEGEDLDLLVTAYAERVTEYPADIIRTACRAMADKSTFFPSWSEMKAELDDWMSSRREIVRGMDTPTKTPMPKEPPKLLQELLRSGQVQPITDAERAWLKTI